MENIKAIEKENVNYLHHDKICNKIDLELYYFKTFLELKEGRSKQENLLLEMLEKEVNNLRYTIECYKKELDNNHFKAIDELKK